MKKRKKENTQQSPARRNIFDRANGCRKLLLRRDIKAVGFKQSVNQPDRFASSKSECASVLVFSNLTEFEVVETPKLRVAFSQRIGGFAKVVAQMMVAELNQAGIFSLEFA